MKYLFSPYFTRCFIFILLMSFTPDRTYAQIDMYFSLENKIINIELLPLTSEVNVEAKLYFENDQYNEKLVASKAIGKVDRGKRLKLQFDQLPSYSDCVYIVKFFFKNQILVETLNLYSSNRSEEKISYLNQFLSFSVEQLGSFLDKITTNLLSPNCANLFEIDFHTQEIKPLTDFTNGWLANPSISANGRIAFHRYINPMEPEIWLSEDTSFIKVASAEAFEWNDESSLFLLKNSNLYLYNIVDGTSARLLRSTSHFDDILGWTQNHSQLILMRQIGSDYEQFWSFNPENNQLKRLPYDNLYTWVSNFSKQKNQIIYHRYGGIKNKNNIYSYDLNSLTENQITNSDEHDDEFPIWSNDGNKVFFLSSRNINTDKE